MKHNEQDVDVSVVYLSCFAEKPGFGFQKLLDLAVKENGKRQNPAGGDVLTDMQVDRFRFGRELDAIAFIRAVKDLFQGFDGDSRLHRELKRKDLNPRYFLILEIHGIRFMSDELRFALADRSSAD